MLKLRMATVAGGALLGLGTFGTIYGAVALALIVAIAVSTGE